MRLTQQRDLLSNSFTIQWVKSTVELVEDVEWQGFDALDGEDQARSYYCFLTSRQVLKRMLVTLGVFLLTDHFGTQLLRKSLSVVKAYQNSNASIQVFSNGQLSGRRELRRI